MLSKGFKEQIYDVYRYLPPETQVVLVSATLPHEVLEMTGKFMTDPVRVLVKRDELTLEGIKQFFVGACPCHLVMLLGFMCCVRAGDAPRLILSRLLSADARMHSPLPIQLLSARSGSSTRCATCTTR